MLSLAAERALDLEQVMAQPGGFAWWYLDLVDGAGRRLVLIWSFGLPFLAGSRREPRPLDRPSLCIATYDAGRCSFYLLQTYAPHDARVDGDGSVQLGRSRFQLVRTATAVQLDARLDLELPGGGRLFGHVQSHGAACRAPLHAGAQGLTTQRWAPILAATSGRVQLRSQDGEELCMEGRAYLDSNTSPLPLHALGIACWRWGRVALSDRDLIFYFVDPEAAGESPIRLALEVERSGRMIEHRVSSHWVGPRRDRFGLPFHAGLRLSSPTGLDAELRFSAPVDAGPFYLRFLAEAETLRGDRGLGLAELAAPGRLDRAWQRPFVRMRTHATAGDNSLWLPLFSGPVQGRFRRLWSGLRHSPRAQQVVR